MPTGRTTNSDAVRALDDAATIQFRMPRSGPGSVILPADLLAARELMGVPEKPRSHAVLRGSAFVAIALTVTAFLVLAHFVALAVSGPTGIPAAVRLGTGQSVSAWFSGALALVDAGLLALVASTSSRRERWRWVLASLAVLLGPVGKALTGPGDGQALHTASGPLTSAWPLSALSIGIAVLLCGSLLLRRPGGRTVALGAAVLLAGATGVEALEVWWFDGSGVASDLVGVALNGIGSTAEMLGLVIALAGLLRMGRGSTLGLAR
ncbi:hypothetical protein GCM10009836_46770 [Pseudonocardia ailaonensis]|uniref:DUF998 domain-containing protein n=1 Tax=Pseudonocardia ailaonensis TaxID=367279 RepID=A0ABN2NB59_9PSEU